MIVVVGRGDIKKKKRHRVSDPPLSFMPMVRSVDVSIVIPLVLASDIFFFGFARSFVVYTKYDGSRDPSIAITLSHVVLYMGISFLFFSLVASCWTWHARERETAQQKQVCNLSYLAV